MIAHVGGVPLEEALTLAAGSGGGLLMARTWLRLRWRRHLPRAD